MNILAHNFSGKWWALIGGNLKLKRKLNRHSSRAHHCLVFGAQHWKADTAAMKLAYLAASWAAGRQACCQLSAEAGGQGPGSCDWSIGGR